MAKNGNKRGVFSLVSGAVFLLAILFLLVYVSTVFLGAEDFYAVSATRNSLVYFEDNLSAAAQAAQVHYDNLYEIADKLQYAESTAKVESVMKSYIGSSQFGNLRFYSQGKTYSVEGSLLNDTMATDKMLAQLAAGKTEGCTPIYHDSYSGYDCISFFVPVKGSAFVDGVLSIVPARNIVDLSGALGQCDAAFLVDAGGRVLSVTEAEGFDQVVGSDFYDFLNAFAADKEEINQIGLAILSGKMTALPLNSAGGEYTVSMASVPNMSGSFTLLTLRPTDELVYEETEYIRHIINLAVIAVLCLAIGAVFAFANYRKARAFVPVAAGTHKQAGCPDAEQFKTESVLVLQEKRQNYALCLFELRQYGYLEDKLSTEALNALLKDIAGLFETFASPLENYGYMGDGRFALMLCYEGERSVRERARLMEAMAGKHRILGQSKSKKKFNIGVSLAPANRNNTVSSLLDQAGVACDKAKNNVNSPYEIYSERVGQERAQSDRIEAEMETALATGEFRLFLQPKYNIKEDKIDSAEALVRWFDTKTGDYRFPGEFIGIFEANGFIVKLDKFMYVEALKLLNTGIQRGDKIVPISVNVSLVTATSSDFLSFYVDNKKKYGIPDGMIVVELTENFGGDYEAVRKTVTALRKAGIGCSIDNFGSGYSSLGALKNIPLDEVKLDRMFLKTGYSTGSDDAVQQATVNLAKALGLKVVQQGVETKEMFDCAVNKGCDVIQGYYYAKAIPAEEYRLFLGSNTSIKYKSLVK